MWGTIGWGWGQHEGDLRVTRGVVQELRESLDKRLQERHDLLAWVRAGLRLGTGHTVLLAGCVIARARGVCVNSRVCRRVNSRVCRREKGRGQGWGGGVGGWGRACVRRCSDSP